MTIVIPIIDQKNLYIKFMQHLNINNGTLDCNDVKYYDFLDKNRVLHSAVLTSVNLCQKLFGQLHILHHDGRVTKTAGGTFYLTFGRGDISCNLDASQFPKPIKPPQKLDEYGLPEHLSYLRPLENKVKEEQPEKTWTKEEVIKLLTCEAHIVGGMLGYGYNKLKPIHAQWIREWILNPKKLQVSIYQAHRNFYKTTCLRLAVAIIIILMPMETILLLRKSEDAVKEVVNGVSKILDTPLFYTFINILYPDIKAKGGFKKVVDTALSIDTNLNLGLSGEYQLRAAGLGSPLTGKHATKIFTDDICFVAGTKIATPFGDKNIEDLKIGDKVITPFGYQKITKCLHRYAAVMDNCGLTGTQIHPIYNKYDNKFDYLCNADCNNLSIITEKDLKQWQIAKTLLNGMVGNGKKQQENIIYCGQFINIGLEKCFMERYGRSITEKFQKDILYTIKTIIPTIIALIIWNAYRLGNIKECMLSSALKFLQKICLKKQGQLKLNGSKQKQEKRFLEKILQNIMRNVKKNTLKKLSARHVGQYILQIPGGRRDYAGCAEKERQLGDIILQKEKQKVYNIEVENDHIYYANSVLVHNCTEDDRNSEAERMITIRKYQELVNILSDDDNFSDSQLINIGTPWHEEDVFKLMELGLPDKCDKQVELGSKRNKTQKEKDIIARFDSLRGKMVCNCYQSGLMSKQQIERKRKMLNDDALFLANYMLELVSDDEYPFPRINNVGKYRKSYFSESWEVFAAIDAAYGGTDATALSIGAHDWDTNDTVVLGKLWKGISLEENYLELAEIMYECGVQTVSMESNTDKGLMGTKFRELGFNVDGYHEGQNKHVKIQSTIRPFWREGSLDMLPSVQFVEETDEEYLSQIHNYKKGVKKDDAPDNLACLLLRGKFGVMSMRVT